MPQAFSTDSNWSARLWWTLAGVGLLDWSFRIVSSAHNYKWASWTALLAGSWGLGTVLVSWVPQIASPRARRYGNVFAWATALIAVLCFAVWAALAVHASPAYGTDELAFDQYAAWLVQHGHNPYTHSMAGAFGMFQVSPGGYTFTLAGARVTTFSYPALGFLLYVPFLLLGWSRQLGVGLDVIGWVISTLLIFKLLPRSARPAALVLGSAMAYVQLSVIGLTDMMFMPMLVLAAYRWDRFGSGGWRTYIGPVMLGLAMAVKQTPWPVIAFVLAALVLDERARTDLRTGLRRAGRYLAAVVIAFVIPNLPYIVAAPSAWARGTLTPLLRSLVPAGQGAVSFTLFLHMGGGSLTAYSLLLVFVMVLLLVTFVGTYPLMRVLLFTLPAVAYFFAVRSYTAYLLALVPPGLVAAVSTQSQPVQAAARLFRTPRWAAASAAAAGLCLLTLIYALDDGAPLKITINNVNMVGQTNIGEQIYATVKNFTGSRVTPHFTIQTDSGVSSFWNIDRGPRSLGPGASADYVLGSTDSASQFTANAGLTVLGFISSPKSVSVSNRFLPRLWHVGWVPESEWGAVPIGQKLNVSVQLLDEWNDPIKLANVPVTLGQNVAVSQSGLPNQQVKHLRVASIDDKHRGLSATVETNSDGLAKFTIVGKTVSLYPDTLSVTIPSGRPWGYQAASSNTFLLRFRAR